MQGVQKKFEYKLRLVYAHFPINVNIINGGKAPAANACFGRLTVRWKQFF